MKNNQIALQIAAQSWCQPTTSNKEMDADMAIGIAQVIDPLLDHLQSAWGIIVNAGGGDWNNESEEWTNAANEWRNIWHDILNAKLPETLWLNFKTESEKTSDN